ncbi:MAG TPA: DUF4296 domain-containing protein [Pedobacter sp.]
MRRLLLLFFLFVFISSCSEGVPKGIIPQEAMINVLTDLHLAGGFAYAKTTDSTKFDIDIVYKSIYKKHKTDSATVKKSVAYYSRNPEKFDLIYKQVELNLNKLQNFEREREIRIQQLAAKRQQRLEAIKMSKAKVAADGKEMLKGIYDFNLPEYTLPGAVYFTNWNMTSRAPYKTISSKTDSTKKASLSKKLNKK